MRSSSVPDVEEKAGYGVSQCLLPYSQDLLDRFVAAKYIQQW